MGDELFNFATRKRLDVPLAWPGDRCTVVAASSRRARTTLQDARQDYAIQVMNTFVTGGQTLCAWEEAGIHGAMGHGVLASPVLAVRRGCNAGFGREPCPLRRGRVTSLHDGSAHGRSGRTAVPAGLQLMRQTSELCRIKSPKNKPPPAPNLAHGCVPWTGMHSRTLQR